ncbi:Mediator of DNA damage checkpoint protein 1 [Rhizoclosmatium hyalinum]|nr:Mediator of DNA damage checkpoint protein 1 [Rhizoclosmatium hyalinum]
MAINLHVGGGVGTGVGAKANEVETDIESEVEDEDNEDDDADAAAKAQVVADVAKIVNAQRRSRRSSKVVATLRVLEGPQVTTEATLPITEGYTVLGRATEDLMRDSVCLLAYEGVSSTHALIEVIPLSDPDDEIQEYLHIVQDLHSTNRTSLGPDSLCELIPRKPYPLLHGAHVSFGPVRCIYEYTVPPQPLALPTPQTQSKSTSTSTDPPSTRDASTSTHDLLPLPPPSSVPTTLPLLPSTTPTAPSTYSGIATQIIPTPSVPPGIAPTQLMPLTSSDNEDDDNPFNDLRRPIGLAPLMAETQLLESYNDDDEDDDPTLEPASDRTLEAGSKQNHGQTDAATATVAPTVPMDDEEDEDGDRQHDGGGASGEAVQSPSLLLCAPTMPMEFVFDETEGEEEDGQAESPVLGDDALGGGGGAVKRNLQIDATVAMPDEDGDNGESDEVTEKSGTRRMVVDATIAMPSDESEEEEVRRPLKKQTVAATIAMPDDEEDEMEVDAADQGRNKFMVDATMPMPMEEVEDDDEQELERVTAKSVVTSTVPMPDEEDDTMDEELLLKPTTVTATVPMPANNDDDDTEEEGLDEKTVTEPVKVVVELPKPLDPPPTVSKPNAKGKSVAFSSASDLVIRAGLVRKGSGEESSDFDDSDATKEEDTDAAQTADESIVEATAPEFLDSPVFSGRRVSSVAADSPLPPLPLPKSTAKKPKSKLIASTVAAVVTEPDSQEGRSRRKAASSAQSRIHAIRENELVPLAQAPVAMTPSITSSAASTPGPSKIAPLEKEESILSSPIMVSSSSKARAKQQPVTEFATPAPVPPASRAKRGKSASATPVEESTEPLEPLNNTSTTSAKLQSKTLGMPGSIVKLGSGGLGGTTPPVSSSSSSGAPIAPLDAVISKIAGTTPPLHSATKKYGSGAKNRFAAFKPPVNPAESSSGVSGTTSTASATASASTTEPPSSVTVLSRSASLVAQYAVSDSFESPMRSDAANVLLDIAAAPPIIVAIEEEPEEVEVKAVGRGGRGKKGVAAAAAKPKKDGKATKASAKKDEPVEVVVAKPVETDVVAEKDDKMDVEDPMTLPKLGAGGNARKSATFTTQKPKRKSAVLTNDDEDDDIGLPSVPTPSVVVAAAAMKDESGPSTSIPQPKKRRTSKDKHDDLPVEDLALSLKDPAVFSRQSIALKRSVSVQSETQDGTGKRGRKKSNVSVESIVGGSSSIDAAGFKVMFTGIDDSEKLKTIVSGLGGTCVDSWNDCSHLVTDKVRRTVKFLSALAAGKHIVSTKWLDHCKKEGKFVDETKFIIKDKPTESKYSFSLDASIKAAQEKAFLTGFTIYTTPNVKPSRLDMKEIIAAAGGTVSPCLFVVFF